MTTLVEFLTARLDEDEQRATRASHDSIGNAVYRDLGCRSDDVLFAAKVGSPARVLADVAAKRAILAVHRPVRFTDVTLGLVDVEVCRSCHSHLDYPDDWDEERAEDWTYPLVQDAYPCDTVRALLQPYADHPDFDPAWRDG